MPPRVRVPTAVRPLQSLIWLGVGGYCLSQGWPTRDTLLLGFGAFFIFGGVMYFRDFLRRTRRRPGEQTR